MSKSLTPTANALLGLLAIGPLSTYELAKQVERSLGWFWPRTERKIYDEAKRLVETGYARSTNEDTGARRRTVYHLTAKGRRTLQTWLGETSAPPKLEAEALVRVFFSDAGTLEQLRATLAGFANEASAKLVILHELIDSAQDPDYAYAERLHINALALRFQLDYHEMMISWTQWATEQIEQWPDTTDPGRWEWISALPERQPPRWEPPS
jgi:PadR family transcriptional regulator AphA